jgi:ferredoxin--NADP+ reductase
MAINWIESKVIDQVKWTDDLVSIRFENNVPAYTAGQFTKIGLKIDGEIISRPYSLVSAPHEDFLEVIYVNVPDGKLTPKLHNLKKDDTIYVMDKSSGFFVMDEVPDGDKLWLIATGTGLGVFISLLKTDAPWGRFKEIVLVHGVRTGDELTYQKQIEEFQNEHPNQLKYIQTVTREKIDNALNSRIPEAIKDNTITDICGNIDKSSQFMLCGNPDMINDMVDLLGEYGLERNRRSKPGNITLEKYW